MLVKFCDKCGKKIESDIDPDLARILGFPSYHIERITRSYNDEEVNLCRYCSKAFEEWLKTKEKEDQNAVSDEHQV